MIEEFDGLTPEEQDVLNNIPVWITILIAGADNKIDKKEIKEALSITALKKKRARKELLEYYNAISKKFESNLNGYLTLLPEEKDERAKLLIKNISRINPIIGKLDHSFAVQLYESLKDLAKRVAQASGGVMGFLSIGYEESKLVELKMIKDPSN